MSLSHAAELLEQAAMKGDGAAIDRLFEIFGEFEMPGAALALAVRDGNEGAARALVSHDVSIGVKMRLIEQKGDTEKKVINRVVVYIDQLTAGNRSWATSYVKHGFTCQRESPIPDHFYEVAISKAGLPLIRALADEGLLGAKDLKGLMLGCLSRWWDDRGLRKKAVNLARHLAEIGAINNSDVITGAKASYSSYWLDGAGRERLSKLPSKTGQDFAALLHSGVSPEAAAAIFDLMPECAEGLWEAGFITRSPEMARAIVPYLNEPWFGNAGALLSMLAKNGWDEEAKTVCGWEGKVTEKMMEKAIAAAQAAGQTSAVATLLQLKAERFGGGGGGGLEL